MSYWNNGTGSNSFENSGISGKYHSSTTVADGQTDYTGSNYGYGAVMVVTHGSAVLHLQGGGSIPAANLVVKEIYDLSISKITAASSATIYVMKRKGL